MLFVFFGLSGLEFDSLRFAELKQQKEIIDSGAITCPDAALGSIPLLTPVSFHIRLPIGVRPADRLLDNSPSSVAFGRVSVFVSTREARLLIMEW